MCSARPAGRGHASTHLMALLTRCIHKSFLPWLALMAGVVALLGLAVTQTVTLPSLDNLAVEGLRERPA